MLETASQARIFGGYALIGLIVGALYTVRYFAVCLFGRGKAATVVADAVFGALVCVPVIIGGFRVNFGEIKAYCLLGVCCGATAYLLTFHKIVCKLIDKLSVVFSRLNARADARLIERRAKRLQRAQASALKRKAIVEKRRTARETARQSVQKARETARAIHTAKRETAKRARELADSKPESAKSRQLVAHAAVAPVSATATVGRDVHVQTKELMYDAIETKEYYHGYHGGGDGAARRHGHRTDLESGGNHQSQQAQVTATVATVRARQSVR